MTTSGPVRSLRTLALDEFLTLPDPEVAEVVRGLLPSEGIALLLGAEKVGKSLLGQQLALCLARGVPFLGFEVVPSSVLLVEEEGARHVVRGHLTQQMEAIGAVDAQQHLGVAHRQRLRLDDAGSLAGLEEVIEQDGVKVVVMGPLAQLAGLEDENKANGYNGIARSLLDIVERRNILFVIAHHRRKPDARGNDPKGVSAFFNSSRGSNALTAAMDVGIGLHRDPASSDGSLYIMGRDVEAHRLSINFDSKSLLFTRATPEATTTIEKHLTILVQAMEKGPVTVAEAMGLLDVSRNTARARLRQLVEDGVAIMDIREHDAQVYRLRDGASS